MRKTLRHEQLRAKLVDLVLQTLTTIRIGLVSLCQSQPCVRHLQENSTLLFIPSGLSYFQTLCGEATVLVRLTHRNRAPDFSAIFFFNAENSRRFRKIAAGSLTGPNSQGGSRLTAELRCNGYQLMTSKVSDTNKGRWNRPGHDCVIWIGQWKSEWLVKPSDVDRT